MPNNKSIIEKINSKPYNSNIKFDELQSYYEHFGFRLVRTASSHKVFRNSIGMEAIVPTHDNKVKACYVKRAHDLVKIMEGKDEKGKE